MNIKHVVLLNVSEVIVKSVKRNFRDEWFSA